MHALSQCAYRGVEISLAHAEATDCFTYNVTGRGICLASKKIVSINDLLNIAFSDWYCRSNAYHSNWSGCS